MGMSEEFVLPSGAKLSVTVGPFWDCVGLNDAVTLVRDGLPKTGNPEEDSTRAFYGVARDAGIQEMLRQKFFPRCTYDGQKIVEEMFDNEKMTEKVRRDYYSLCERVIFANCKGFFG